MYFLFSLPRPQHRNRSTRAFFSDIFFAFVFRMRNLVARLGVTERIKLEPLDPSLNFFPRPTQRNSIASGHQPSTFSPSTTFTSHQPHVLHPRLRNTLLFLLGTLFFEKERKLQRGKAANSWPHSPHHTLLTATQVSRGLHLTTRSLFFYEDSSFCPV